ncbi:MAG: hypothetical protein ACKVK8_09375 [Rhodospirillales bacterium]
MAREIGPKENVLGKAVIGAITELLSDEWLAVVTIVQIISVAIALMIQWPMGRRFLKFSMIKVPILIGKNAFISLIVGENVGGLHACQVSGADKNQVLWDLKAF